RFGFYPSMIDKSLNSQKAFSSSLTIALSSELRYWRRVWNYAAECGRLRPGIDRDDTLRWILYLQTTMTVNSTVIVRSSMDLRKFAKSFVVTALLLDSDEVSTPPPAAAGTHKSASRRTKKAL